MQRLTESTRFIAGPLSKGNKRGQTPFHLCGAEQPREESGFVRASGRNTGRFCAWATSGRPGILDTDFLWAESSCSRGTQAEEITE